MGIIEYVTQDAAVLTRVATVHGIYPVNAATTFIFRTAFFFRSACFRGLAIFGLAAAAIAPAAAYDAAPDNAAAVATGATASDSEELALNASFAAAASRLKDAPADTRYEQLFNAWENLDGPRTTVAATLAIPSRQPVDHMNLSSNFGTRADPFNGRAKAHQGVDIPGAIGSPIYATADGIVAKAEWFGGYGNFVQIAHGNTIETRYGHMSKIAVHNGDRVRKGQILGYMGSTGRSTGSHLHYEVRINGVAVNPMSFVTPGEVMLASLDTGRGGPGDTASDDSGDD